MNNPTDLLNFVVVALAVIGGGALLFHLAEMSTRAVYSRSGQADPMQKWQQTTIGQVVGCAALIAIAAIGFYVHSLVTPTVRRTIQVGIEPAVLALLATSTPTPFPINTPIPQPVTQTETFIVAGHSRQFLTLKDLQAFNRIEGYILMIGPAALDIQWPDGLYHVHQSPLPARYNVDLTIDQPGPYTFVFWNLANLPSNVTFVYCVHQHDYSLGCS